jgi:hypothetical protein
MVTVTTLHYNTSQGPSFNTGSVTYSLITSSTNLYINEGNSTSTIDGNCGNVYTGNNYNLFSIFIPGTITNCL